MKLPDGVVGSDEEREAKIEETLRRLGVKGVDESTKRKAARAKQGSTGGQVFSVLEVRNVRRSTIEAFHPY